MRILHICAGWEETNGAAVIARLMADEQRRQGHEVVLGSRVTRVEIRAADEVWTHCGWLPVLWWAGVFAKRLVRMPEACYDPVRLAYHGWKKRLVGPVERFFLRRAKKVLATCEAEKEWILAYEPQAKVEVIDVKKYFHLDALTQSRRATGGVDGKQSLCLCASVLKILYLGRRHPLKGVEYLEQAVKELNDESSTSQTFSLRLVSDATGEAKEAQWDWCDVLVLPTLSENFGLVVAEALERGKRVITTDGAPAWDGDDYGGRLVYLRGYRDGSAATRVELLKSALQQIRVSRCSG